MSRHEQIIAALKERDPVLSVKGFRKGVLAALGAADDGTDDEFWVEEFSSVLPPYGKIPDAWKADAEAGEIHCYEVEVTSPLKRRDERFYGDLWFALDAWSWDLKLWRVDHYGVIQPAPLAVWWTAVHVFGDEGVVALVEVVP